MWRASQFAWGRFRQVSAVVLRLLYCVRVDILVMRFISLFFDSAPPRHLSENDAVILVACAADRALACSTKRSPMITTPPPEARPPSKMPRPTPARLLRRAHGDDGARQGGQAHLAKGPGANITRRTGGGLYRRGSTDSLVCRRRYSRPDREDERKRVHFACRCCPDTYVRSQANVAQNRMNVVTLSLLRIVETSRFHSHNLVCEGCRVLQHLARCSTSFWNGHPHQSCRAVHRSHFQVLGKFWMIFQAKVTRVAVSHGSKIVCIVVWQDCRGQLAARHVKPTRCTAAFLTSRVFFARAFLRCRAVSLRSMASLFPLAPSRTRAYRILCRQICVVPQVGRCMVADGLWRIMPPGALSIF